MRPKTKSKSVGKRICSQLSMRSTMKLCFWSRLRLFIKFWRKMSIKLIEGSKWRITRKEFRSWMRKNKKPSLTFPGTTTTLRLMAKNLYSDPSLENTFIRKTTSTRMNRLTLRNWVSRYRILRNFSTWRPKSSEVAKTKSAKKQTPNRTSTWSTTTTCTRRTKKSRT